MPAESDIRKNEEGLEVLREAYLTKIAPAHARMLDPLERAIQGASVTGNDRADMEALSDQLPALFDQMDDTEVVDGVADMLLQTYAVGRTVAVPEGVGKDDFAAPAESLEDTLEA